VLKNHRQIRGHRILILPPRPAPRQSGRAGTEAQALLPEMPRL
jgi:hypothetical protein